LAPIALAIANLTIRDAEGTLLVEDVTLSVRRGGTLTLIGETGSGKSLVAQAIFGLLPSGFRISGGIVIGGEAAIAASDSRALATFWRKRLMLVPQEPAAALDPTMRVHRQMVLAGMPGPQIPAALAAVGLSHRSAGAFPFELSGGMAQRVLVAIALAAGSPIVIADEPTKGLDPELVDQTVSLIGHLTEAGRSLLIITHDRRVAEALNGTLAIMHEGRIVEQGPTRSVLSTPRSEYGQAWLAADPARWPRCQRSGGMSRPVLSADDLSFGWPAQGLLFRDLHLRLAPGHVLAVTGPSGCGKTTLGNILLGLLRPISGSVKWTDTDVVRHPRELRSLRQRYQKLHQDPIAAFMPEASIGRQLRLLERVRAGLAIDRDLPPLMERLKLRAELLDRRVDEVSGGEAQRLALARILLLDPIVIVADEPTSRLDHVVQRDTMSLLREIVDEDRLGLVLISHDRAIVQALADEELRLSSRLNVR